MSEGQKLRNSRMKLRLTQKELANLLGLRRWISSWERGQTPPPPYIWRALAKLENDKKLGRRV